MYNATKFDMCKYVKDATQLWEADTVARALEYARTSNDREASLPWKHALKLTCNRFIGTWITTIPSQAFGTVLTAQEFWDNLRLRYGVTPAGLPKFYVCGEVFMVTHGLYCK